MTAETSIVRLSDVRNAAKTFRLDAEYYHSKNLHAADSARGLGDRIASFSDLGIEISGSAFYPSIEEFYGSGDMPFIRVADVDGFVDPVRCVTIPETLPTLYKTLKLAHPGDIVFTKGGSIARVGLVTRLSAASRDLIVLRTAGFEERDRIFLMLWFESSLFRRLLIRSGSQTAQPHLTITLVRDLPVLLAGNAFKRTVADTYVKASDAYSFATQGIFTAQKLLLEGLKLDKWRDSGKNSYVSHFSAIRESGRMDAEYFRPRYIEMLDHLNSIAVKMRAMDSICVSCERGIQPIYNSRGDLPVINSQHVLDCEVDFRNLERTNTSSYKAAVLSRSMVTSGDILVYSTGAYVGRTAPYLLEFPSMASNHVNIVRVSDENPVYISVVLNSLIGRWQTQRAVSGSAQPELYPTDIKRMWVPFVDAGTEQEIVRLVTEAQIRRRLAFQLIDQAKKAIEISFNESEDTAIDFLKRARDKVDSC